MLSAQQYQAIRYMIEGRKQDDVAKEVGVSARTIRNWLQNEDFQKEYRKEVQKVMDYLSGEAINTLADLMRNSSSDTVRLNACRDILSRAGFDATAKSKVELETPEDIIINIS